MIFQEGPEQDPRPAVVMGEGGEQENGEQILSPQVGESLPFNWGPAKLRIHVCGGSWELTCSAQKALHFMSVIKW